MSDRVAIIGGSTVGRDHFPFAVSDASLPGYGPGTFPFAFDLDASLILFYKVRRWSVTIDLEVTHYASGSPSSRNYSCSFDYGLGVSFMDPVTFEGFGSKAAPDVRESDLIAASRNVPNLNFGPGNDQASFDGDLEFFFPYEVKNFTSAGGDLNPFSTISFVFNPWGLFWVAAGFRPLFVFQISAANFSARTSDNTTGTPTVVGSVRLHGLGVSLIEIDIFAVNTGSGSSYNVLETALCELTPLEYWPYATKPTEADPVGLPVYNTSTGATLRDPFS